MFQRLAKALKVDGFGDDPRFATNADRLRHVEALDTIVGDFVSKRTLDENIGFFEEHDITAGIVADISDLVTHPMCSNAVRLSK